MVIFPSGAVIQRREVLHGQVWLEHPVSVVSDDGDVLAVRLDPGSSFRFPEHPHGPHPWAQHQAWGDAIVLQLSRRNTWYGVWKFFDIDGTFRHWYLNFEPPVVRSEGGIETDDFGLDPAPPSVSGAPGRGDLSSLTPSRASTTAITRSTTISTEWATQ